MNLEVKPVYRVGKPNKSDWQFYIYSYCKTHHDEQSRSFAGLIMKHRFDLGLKAHGLEAGRHQGR